MAVNNYRIILSGSSSKEITIPIELDWDFAGQDQSIEKYEEDVVKEVIGSGYDFELNRFPHDIDTITKKSEINYEFYFYSGGPINSLTSWNNSYISQGFLTKEIYYFTNDFTKSFFKLDFYDTVDDKRQTNYISVIIPTQQGYKTNVLLNNKPVLIKTPKFTLDYVGDKEGFFIYWLKNLDFLPINTFYMSAKFYNAKTGTFTKMMNKPQSSLPSGLENSFDATDNFYYRVVFDYVNLVYRVYRFDTNTNTEQRVGTTTPITWYQYVNP